MNYFRVRSLNYESNKSRGATSVASYHDSIMSRGQRH